MIDPNCPLNIFLVFDTTKHAEEAKAYLQQNFAAQRAAFGKIYLGATALGSFIKESEDGTPCSFFDQEGYRPECLHMNVYGDEDNYNFEPSQILSFFAPMFDIFHATKVSFTLTDDEDTVMCYQWSSEQRDNFIMTFDQAIIDFNTALEGYCAEEGIDPDELGDQGAVYGWTLNNAMDYAHTVTLTLNQEDGDDDSDL